jgi:hypothetical protein
VFCAGAYRTWPGYLHQRAGAAHAQDADGQWSRRCEDGGARKMRGARAGRRRTVESTVCRRWVAQEARRTRRTPTASGVDSVKTVGSARGVKTAGRARGVKTVGRVSGDGMSSLIGLSSFADEAHAQAADGQWSRRCEDAPVATERAV